MTRHNPILLALSLDFALAACGSEHAAIPGSAYIDAAHGGRVTSADGAVVLDIPPGALARDTEITLTEVAPEDWPEETIDHPPLAGVYAFEPDGLAFRSPAALAWTLPSPPPDMLPLVDGFSRSSDGSFEAQDDSVIEYSEAGTIYRTALDHFSHKWAGRSGVMLVSDLMLQPKQNPLGSQWDVSVSVFNASPVVVNATLAAVSVGKVSRQLPPGFGTPFDLEAGYGLRERSFTLGCGFEVGWGWAQVHVVATRTIPGIGKSTSRAWIDRDFECIALAPDDPDPSASEATGGSDEDVDTSGDGHDTGGTETGGATTGVASGTTGMGTATDGASSGDELPPSVQACFELDPAACIACCANPENKLWVELCVEQCGVG